MVNEIETIKRGEESVLLKDGERCDVAVPKNEASRR
jgi:hypothetical protein